MKFKIFLAHPSSAVLNFAQAGLVIFNISLYIQTCVQWPPMGPEKHGCDAEDCMKKISVR